MGTATSATLAIPDTPNVPYNDSKFAPSPAEATSKTKADAKDHTDHEVNDASGTKTTSKRNLVANTLMIGQSDETSTASAPSTNGDNANIDLNGHGEGPAASEKPDDSSPQETRDNHESESVVDNANGNVAVDLDQLRGDAMTPDAVKESCNGIHIQSHINGQQENPVSAPGIAGPFDDIWSPATRLKRRLQKTKDLIVCPGVYDGFSARIALSVGFDTMYMV